MMKLVQFIKLFMNILKKERNFMRYVVTTSENRLFLFHLHYYVIFFLDFTRALHFLSGWKLSLNFHQLLRCKESLQTCMTKNECHHGMCFSRHFKNAT